jgi:hypothetical protein
VPSLGLDENIGARSHGNGASSGAVCCAGGSGGGCCAAAGPDDVTATRNTTNGVTKHLIVEARSSARQEAPFVRQTNLRANRSVCFPEVSRGLDSPFSIAHGLPSMGHRISEFEDADAFRSE